MKADIAAWHAVSAGDAAKRLDIELACGLTAEEASARRAETGPNQVVASGKQRWWQVLFRQFASVLIVILAAAATFSIAIGHVQDAIAIIVILLLNAGLGFTQEWRAERALAALQALLAPTARVLRQGKDREVAAADLVPGDIVLLKVGDAVAADLRLVEAVNLKTDESALTGEAGSVAKSIDPVGASASLAERRSMAYMGTSVTNGYGKGIVVATGMASEFGTVAELTRSVGREQTRLHRQLGVLGRQLGAVAIAVALAVGVVGWLTGKPAFDMVLTAISVAVAVVPEGLPAVVTITLAVGVRAMVRRRALLRRLQAAETLGAATVICTDKTGTLTQNEMMVTQIWLPGGKLAVSGTGYNPNGRFEADGKAIDPASRPDLMALLETGLICNHARLTQRGGVWDKVGEPTEAALVAAAFKAGLDGDSAGRAFTEFSFNSTRKRMTVIAESAEGRIAHIKGAPEVIIERCRSIRDGETVEPLGDANRLAVTDACDAMASAGLRTLALAQRILPADIALDEEAVETELTLLGIVGIIDPPRPEAAEAVAQANSAGIKVVMITGDAAATALAIADRIGLHARDAVSGSDLETMSDQALLARIKAGAVFARTAPEHKMRIVDLLQEQGHVVAMTGDGVNDAPALKAADIGIAMGLRGTDVAKGAADIILTDDNFASIIGAVEEGRRQYDNIRKFVRYLFASNLGEVTAILINIVIGGPLLLLPVQILWMNLVTDGVAALALGLEPAERGIMKRPPRPADEAILDLPGFMILLVVAIYMATMAVWLFHATLADGSAANLALAQTMALTAIVVIQKANVFNFRAFRDPLLAIGVMGNPWLLLAVAGSMGLHMAALYVAPLRTILGTAPLSLDQWGMILMVSLPIFLIPEMVKTLYWLRKQSRPKGAAA